MSTSLNRRCHGLGSPRVAGTLKINVVMTALQEISASKLRVLRDCSISWWGHWDVWAFTSEIRRHTACRDWHSEWWIFMVGSFQVALWGSNITKETERRRMTQNHCICLLKPAEPVKSCVKSQLYWHFDLIFRTLCSGYLFGIFAILLFLLGKINCDLIPWVC